MYTIRGIGYNDFSLNASPTVSVYLDEVPYAFPVLSKGATLDVGQVEILKGPQGTLYGQNATGGAVNYLAAKPTNTFQAGIEATYGNFGSSDLNGYVSGPLAPTLNGRASFDIVGGGAYQKSDTRAQTTGDKDLKKGRVILDWTPSSDLKVSLNLNGLACGPPRDHRGVARSWRWIWTGCVEGCAPGRSGRRQMAPDGERQRSM